MYPLAQVKVETGDASSEVEAEESDTLPMSMSLGTDVPEMFELLDRKLSTSRNPDQWMMPEDAFVATTRAQAKQ